ncbi:hypothetical protein HELRODRAFT_178932 [Helobdella robusta]|uniref:Amino acid permease/ SLC12A domain-containing protein n=1 Tax=Helobdella robusta TaxID=6412 RepID=T1FDX1_HELRO|nr:hypothetical protein HELRODRAFT_178932 [Helobdella robusta]ESN95752.1 hypothetical protein HELRODRAFT_178932 [Helobdella robusta]
MAGQTFVFNLIVIQLAPVFSGIGFLDQHWLENTDLVTDPNIKERHPYRLSAESYHNDDQKSERAGHGSHPTEIVELTAGVEPVYVDEPMSRGLWGICHRQCLYAFSDNFTLQHHLFVPLACTLKVAAVLIFTLDSYMTYGVTHLDSQGVPHFGRSFWAAVVALVLTSVYTLISAVMASRITKSRVVISYDGKY